MNVLLIRWPAVKAKTGLSRSTVRRLEQSGQFPKRRQLGARSVAWLADEIDQWVASRSPAVGGLQ